MTKAELISALAAKFDITQVKALGLVDAYAEHLKADLLASGTAVVHGIGRLKLAERAQRTGRNPKTGEPIIIEAARIVRLNVAKELKELVKG